MPRDLGRALHHKITLTLLKSAWPPDDKSGSWQDGCDFWQNGRVFIIHMNHEEHTFVVLLDFVNTCLFGIAITVIQSETL